jgi:N4-gp56 family major capsid protein
MASHSWTYDAPSGVYKNHALASKIRMASIAMTQFMQFTKPVDGYGSKKGSNVTITRVSNVAVPSDDSLIELERIPEDTLSLSTQAISVVERGRAIPYTSLSLDLAHFDIESAIQKKLRDQLSLRLDQLSATAFKVGQVKAIPTGIGELTLDSDGTASSTAAANLNVYHVEQIRDQMFSTYNMMPYEGGDYMAVVSTKARRGIMRDPNWEKWKTYTDAEAKYNGEIGRIEGVRFVESNNTNALSGSLGVGSVLGEAVFFGDDPVAMASVADPELRAKESEDYGRAKGVAWYGIYGFDQIWKDSATAGEARVIHVTSASV